MKFRSLGKLGNRLLNSIIFSAILIILVVIILAFLIRFALDANIKGQRILDDIEVSANQLFRAIIDQETGQRGYSLTTDEEFLDPYYIGREQFSISSAELLNKTKSFEKLHIKALEIVELGEYWQATYAEPFVEQERTGENLNISLLDDAKHVSDNFRIISYEFSKYIDEERTVVRNTMKQRINMTLISLVAFIIVIILTNLLINYRILKSLIKPIIKLSNCVKSYTEHDFTKEVPIYHKQDELSELIRNVGVMRKELSSNIHSLEAKVNFDGLTGLYNRRYFNELFTDAWQVAIEKSKPLSFLLLDIDYFKGYNDTYGHLKGDEILKTISKTLKEFNQEPNSYVARLGGEEFVVLLRDRDKEQSFQVAEEIREAIVALEIPHQSSHINKYVTVSIGVSSITPSVTNKPVELYKMADQALYESKNNGRNRVTKYQNVSEYETI